MITKAVALIAHITPKKILNGLSKMKYRQKVRNKKKMRDSSDMIYTLSACACDDWERVIDWKGEQK